MGLFTVLSVVNGALALYSGVKGMFDSAKAKEKRENSLKKISQAESNWFRRNYFGDYLNSSSSRAAIKRVEKTLRKQNEQNRAYAAINGATPELAVARNQKGLDVVDNVMTNIASQSDALKRNVDSTHLKNRQAIANRELSQLSLDERMAAQSATKGLDLFKDAMMGLNWGNEVD
ncbi:MAG: hypothetical protein IJZ22_07875 [Bacteroidaceae bacterium]|nr:hypothetical protein [Bacteroidaceae bacterium]